MLEACGPSLVQPTLAEPELGLSVGLSHEEVRESETQVAVLFNCSSCYVKIWVISVLRVILC